MKAPVRKISPSATLPKQGSLSPLAGARAGGDTLSNWNTPQGMILHKVGNEIKIGNTVYRCKSVSESCAKFVNIKNSRDVQNFSNCHDVGERVNFTSGTVRAEVETVQPDKTKEQHSMKNKDGKPGKIEFIDSLLLSGKHTKAEIQAMAERKFPGIGHQTTNWCASTIKERTGKESKHKPALRAAKKSAKKASAKAPTRKPAKAPKRKATATSAAETV